MNRGHTSADLALPIDDKADQVYGAIDGQRTAKDIMAASRTPDAGFAVRVLERLWLHDQIAIGVSNAVQS